MFSLFRKVEIMKKILSLIILIISIITGFYLGIYMMLYGGIMQIINNINPLDLTSVILGLIRVLLSSMGAVPIMLGMTIYTIAKG